MQAVESGWHAVRVKPQHERTTAVALEVQNLESYVPLYRVRRKWSDRIKHLDLPLFAGYVFCRFLAGGRARVLATPGVYSIVGFVSESEIETIRRMEHSGARMGPWPYLKAGQHVRIDSGPLAGLTGVLACAPASWHVVVNVELLQRSVAVAVDQDQIRILAQASACA